MSNNKKLKKGDFVQIGGIGKRTVNYGRRGDIREIYPDGRARVRVGPRKYAIARIENLMLINCK